MREFYSQPLQTKFYFCCAYCFAQHSKRTVDSSRTNTSHSQPQSSNFVTMNITNTNTCILTKLKGKPVLFQRSCGCLLSFKTIVSRLQKYSSDQTISSTIFVSSPIHGAVLLQLVTYYLEIRHSQRTSCTSLPLLQSI